MKHRGSYTTINDLLHAIVVVGALAATAYGLSDELFDFRSEHMAAMVAYALAVGGVTYAAVLARPSVAAVRAALMRRRSAPGATSL
jgi:uncharacterized membrane protein required for colicin V production